jgi:hypothetical protein
MPAAGRVEQAFRNDLDRGVFARGFLRWHCDERRRDLLAVISKRA